LPTPPASSHAPPKSPACFFGHPTAPARLSLFPMYVFFKHRAHSPPLPGHFLGLVHTFSPPLAPASPLQCFCGGGFFSERAPARELESRGARAFCRSVFPRVYLSHSNNTHCPPKPFPRPSRTQRDLCTPDAPIAHPVREGESSLCTICCTPMMM
jgi:hypothetical protein